MESVRHAIAAIAAKASELRDAFGDDARARALEWAMAEVEAALTADTDHLLTLAEASARSGYSVHHLGRLIRRGRIPNSGRRGAPRIRVGDLPMRPRRAIPLERTPTRSTDDARSALTRYDPRTDAQSLASRRSGVAHD